MQSESYAYYGEVGVKLGAGVVGVLVSVGGSGVSVGVGGWSVSVAVGVMVRVQVENGVKVREGVQVSVMVGV